MSFKIFWNNQSRIPGMPTHTLGCIMGHRGLGPEPHRSHQLIPQLPPDTESTAEGLRSPNTVRLPGKLGGGPGGQPPRGWCQVLLGPVRGEEEVISHTGLFR